MREKREKMFFPGRGERISRNPVQATAAGPQRILCARWTSLNLPASELNRTR